MSKKITLEGLDHFKDKENAMIAGKPESTNTATVAHDVGEYFYWKGVLHIVTAAIAVGGTIQTNTNVKPAVLADDVSDLKESINHDRTIRDVFPTPFLPLSKLRKRAYIGTKYSCSIGYDGIVTIYHTETSNPQFLLTGPEKAQIQVASSTNSELSCFYLPNGQYTLTAEIIEVEETGLNAYLYVRPINASSNALGTTQLTGHVEKDFTIADGTNYPSGFYALFIRYNAPMNGKVRFTIKQKQATSLSTTAMMLENM